MLLTGKFEPTNESYAIAKTIVAHLCKYITLENKGLNYKTLIPCNLYGKWDKFEPNIAHMIPGVMYRIHKAKKINYPQVEIWGNSTTKREFLYAGDLADCLINAVNNFDTLPLTMNVGAGYDNSIAEYYEIIAKIIGYKGNFILNKDKPIGMKRKIVDITKQKQWGWQAKTSLSDGIKSTYNFFVNQIEK
jgi:GDP-L-fucose synthase